MVRLVVLEVKVRLGNEEIAWVLTYLDTDE